MDRRRFGHLSSALAFSIASGGASQGADVRGLEFQSAPLDRFGGWTGRKFSARGYFRLEKDRRWWLVTPEGNAFLSFGINHLHPDLWKQDFNREIWQERLGVADLNDWSDFSRALRNWFLETCRDFGFNTAGVHNSLNVLNRPRAALPYMQSIRFVDIPHWKTEIPHENFVDVFEPSFEAHCDRLAKEFASPDDPFLLAYSMTDCPLLTEEDCRERPDVIGGARRESRIGWPRRLRNLGQESAGKRAYVETMRQLYRARIEDFNDTYGTTFESFAALRSAKGWRPSTDLSNANETRDNVEFLKRVVERYYQTAHDAIRRYDPHHMFFGDKLNGNTDTVDTVLPVTTQFTDAVLYQMYGRYEVQQPGLDRWSSRIDQPLINGDSAFTMIADTMPRPFGPIADTLEERAAWTTEFFVQAFARADFVGWHYCGLIDATQQIERKRARQHSGLMDSFGNPYAELQSALKKCSENLYAIGTGEFNG